jgi:3-deoxy-7-phosphoheptulonate synthase
MIIVLKEGASREDAEAILAQIEKLGLKPLYMPGQEKIVLGALGDERVLEGLHLESLSTVERVVPILKPYKLANRAFHHEGSKVRVGDVTIGGPELVVMAGPCSVEGRDQIVDTAKAVKAAGARVLRGGAFKPRTSPYAFQGLEEEGLELLAIAREETGLPVVTEVMSEQEVNLIAKYADMFQIGARNMQNFRLLKAVGQTDRPVLLKRGPAASMSDWLMAAEYVMSEGNLNVVLCERGVKGLFQDTRNMFDLSIIPLVRQETHLPVVADPSHGTGVRRIVPRMALAAIACGADGLMIEVHPEPDHAWSDGFQQLDFAEFRNFMDQARPLAAAVGRVLA